MSNNQTLSVQVIVYLDADKWVAQCIDHDIAAQGNTRAECMESFVKQMSAEIILSLDLGKVPLSDIPPAPAYFKQLFQKAPFSTLNQDSVSVRSTTFTPDSRVMIPA